MYNVKYIFTETIICNCSMFCCTLLYVHSSIAIILMGKRERVALLNMSSWCLVMVEWLFFAVPWGYLRFVIVVFPDHTHLLFFTFKQDNLIIVKFNVNLKLILICATHIKRLLSCLLLCQNYPYHSPSVNKLSHHTVPVIQLLIYHQSI